MRAHSSSRQGGMPPAAASRLLPPPPAPLHRPLVQLRRRRRGAAPPDMPAETYTSEMAVAARNDAAAAGSASAGASAPAAAARSHPPPRPQARHPPLPPLVEQVLSSPTLERPEGTDPHQLLKVMEAFWADMKRQTAAAAAADALHATTQQQQQQQKQHPPPPDVVRREPGRRLAAVPDVDVAVAGGTLGILLALSLQARGHTVAVVERRRLQGRNQEWNIARDELEQLVQCGLLSRAELEACIISEFNPLRVGFKNSGGGDDFSLLVSDVLNCGVCPRLLLDTLRRRFLAGGGLLLEGTALQGVLVADDGVELALAPGRAAAPDLEPGDVNRPMAMAVGTEAAGPSGGGAPPRRRLTARLLLDCMGHWSGVVKQMRQGRPPDGFVLVVGGCWQGAGPSSPSSPSSSSSSNSPSSSSSSSSGGDAGAASPPADLLYTFTDASDDLQLFWEAFPAADRCRTSYMFAYADSDPSRPSFTKLLDTYLNLLPQYQGVPLDQLQPKRILMGGFPCYADAPLRPGWDRVLQVGDASAAHSPLSFGGFGAMVRHLPRLTRGLHEALQQDRLARGDLGWLQPYQPALSAAWLLQRGMAIKPGQLAAPPAAAAAAATSSSGSSSTTGTSSAAAGRGWMPADQVNRLLRCNFGVLCTLGDWVLRPFLRDTLQALPLALTMWGMMLRDPIAILRVLRQLSPSQLLSWAAHFGALTAYAVGNALLAPLRPLAPRSWHWQRLLDALEVGSGADYQRHHDHSPDQDPVPAAAAGASSAHAAAA